MGARVFWKIILIILFGWAQYLFWQSEVFLVREVRVHGNFVVSEQEIISNITVMPGDNYWVDRLLGLFAPVKKMPQLRDVSVRMGEDGIVVIDVLEQEPVAVVNTYGYRVPWVAVDVEGVVLGAVPEHSPLPKIALGNGVLPLVRVDRECISTVLKSHPRCQEIFGPSLLYYTFHDQVTLSAVVEVLHYPTLVYLGDVEDWDYLAKVIRSLLVVINREGKPVKSLDLRCVHPVVSPLVVPKVSASPTNSDEGVSSEDVGDSDGAIEPSESVAAESVEDPPEGQVPEQVIESDVGVSSEVGSSTDYQVPEQDSSEPYPSESGSSESYVAPDTEPVYEPAPESAQLETYEPVPEPSAEVLPPE